MEEKMVEPSTVDLMIEAGSMITTSSGRLRRRS
jgi:hypothetical protein